jgi:MFS transporter, DHA1 family, inner membrane transport protein
VTADSRKFPEVFSNREIVAVVIFTIGSGIIRALQPLLLGALVHENRLTVAELGLAAMLELLMIGITIGAAGTWLKPERLRAISVATVIASVVFNIGSVFASPFVFMLFRALAGVSSGLVLWILFGMVARLRVPARVMGLYIGLQAGVALAMASFCSWYIIPTFGAGGGFIALSLLSLALIACIPSLPPHFGPLAVQQSDRSWPGLRGFTALFAVFCCSSGIMSLWVYIDPVARQGGLGADIIGYAISAGLGIQILGGWVASFFGHRLSAVAVITLGGCVNILVLGFLWIGLPPLMFVAAIAIFGFLWAFVLSFITPFMIKMDPTGHAVMLIGSAELFGAAAGPALVSLFVNAIGAQAAPMVSATLFATSALICVALQFKPARVPLAVG